MNEIKKYNDKDFLVDADVLMNFMKFRRSVRLFSKKDVEEEKIAKIIEAGKFTQTGLNAQDVSHVVVQDKILKLRQIVLETLDKQADYLLANESTTAQVKRYSCMWKDM